jgi:hypothetical protein
MLLLEIVETILKSWVTKVQLIVGTTVVYVFEEPIKNPPLYTRDNNITNNNSGGSIPI